MSDINTNLAFVRERLAEGLKRGERLEGAAKLVAVSKKQPVERVEAALKAGQRVFGENYVQEAQERWTPLKERHPDLELHLIGALQTNKAADAVAFFDVIQTVDRPKLAKALAKEAAKQGRCPKLLVQVNTGAEDQKAGCAAEDLPELLKLCREDLGLPVIGLMAIPPAGEDVAPHAKLLAELAAEHDLPEVSVGMSNDYEVAARFGSTIVRVGSAIFGARPPKEG